MPDTAVKAKNQVACCPRGMNLVRSSIPRSCHQLSISIQNPCEGFISFVDLPAGRRGNPSISYAVCSRRSWSNSHRPGSRQKPVLSKDPDHALSPKDAREVGSQLHRSVHISNIIYISCKTPVCHTT